MKKHIPNLLTLLNATSGALAIYVAFTYSLEWAFWLIILAAVLDFFDGLVARWLKAYSALGKDLDSLADVISFGVAPASMMVVALQSIGMPEWIALLSYLIVPASVYRLAKFNHDVRQTSTFIGLPTPANALFFSSLSVWIVTEQTLLTTLPRMIQYKVYGLFIVLVFLFSYLLVSELPMFSLKQRSKGTLVSLAIIVVVSIVGIVLWGYLGIALGLFTYLILNLLPLLRRTANW